MSEKEWILWENPEMSLQAAFNPAISREEGFHLVLLQKTIYEHPSDPLLVDPILQEHERVPREKAPSPWANPELYGRMSVVAANACRVMWAHKMADWFNIHCDGNIGAAQGKPVMHIHIFGRYKTGKQWGGPLQLPSGEGPYGNRPFDQVEIQRLRRIFNGNL